MGSLQASGTESFFWFILLHVFGTGVGLLIAGPIFGCKMHPAKAFAAAAVGALFYYFLGMGIGGPVSFLVIVILARQWGTGDWQEAFLTTIIARGVLLIVLLLWATRNAGP